MSKPHGPDPIRPGHALIAVATLALALAGCGTGLNAPDGSSAPTAEPTAHAAPAFADMPGLWTDATASTIGEEEDWTNRVELADVNDDGRVDILFANGGDYDGPGDPVPTRVFLNQGDGEPFREATSEMLGDFAGFARVVRVRDLNADGLPEIVIGTTWETQSRLFTATGPGRYADVTADRFPAADMNIGDLEFGDVDADGDLDIALADWGPGNPLEIPGGRVRLWLNDGTGTFTDATDAQMPERLVGFSWDLEFVDVDNDWDIDLAVSAKLADTSYLYDNDGTGTFTDVTADRLPAHSNNYDFEPIDLNADGSLDLLTINDGSAATEHAFVNNGDGSFTDATAELWPMAANPSADDNNIFVLDVESDGDPDFVIASLSGPDRLLVNDGTGHLAVERAPFDAEPSAGTLWMAAADLNGDDRLDVVEAQGEVFGAFDDRVYLATDALPPDTAPPIIATDLTADPAPGTATIRARIHDNRTPNMPHDWQSVELRWTADGAPGTAPMVWYGEHLWRADMELPARVSDLEVCAIDAAGNETCRPGA